MKRERDPGNRNIQVPGGEENNSDFPSSGERKGRSPNHRDMGLKELQEAEAEEEPNVMGSRAEEGESPVGKRRS